MVSRFRPALVHSVRLVASSPKTVYKHSHFKSFRIHTCRQLRVLAEIDRYLPSVTPLDSTLTKTTPANFSRMNTYEKRGEGARVSGFVLANPELQKFHNGTNARQHSTKVALQSAEHRSKLNVSTQAVRRTDRSGRAGVFASRGRH